MDLWTKRTNIGAKAKHVMDSKRDVLLRVTLDWRVAQLLSKLKKGLEIKKKVKSNWVKSARNSSPMTAISFYDRKKLAMMHKNFGC